MDDLGNRIIADKAQIAFNLAKAEERQAAKLRREADEIEWRLDQARQAQRA